MDVISNDISGIENLSSIQYCCFEGIIVVNECIVWALDEYGNNNE